MLGLITKRERWGLSWRGWLIVFGAALLAFSIFLFRIYPFLAITHRVDAKVLVVEGWVHGYAIRAAMEEFKRGSYKQVFTTGGPEPGTGGYINDYQTEASVGGELLKSAGVPGESLQMVPSRIMDRDRTYGAAVALRNWFREHNVATDKVNVLTEDVHARRTRLLFQKALGNDVAVGIIAVPSPDYDSKRWWRYSQGVKDVVSEAISCFYAKLLFHPSDSSPGD
jgi:uncharacterized SAM-binding protein YcdF (DUF218 family)